MLADIKFKNKSVSISDINILPIGITNIPEVPYCCPPFHPESTTGILTRDSALLLLRLHPLVLWNKDTKYYCVLGRRVLQIVLPHVYGTDEINVGVLPDATENEIRLLMTVEPLLNQITFATQSGSQNIYETSRKIDKTIVNSVSPILNKSIESISKLFSDCSPSTLFKLNTKLDADK